jgi:hypothetical protein
MRHIRLLSLSCGLIFVLPGCVADVEGGDLGAASSMLTAEGISVQFRLDSKGEYVIVDATGDRIYQPLPDTPRTFATVKTMIQYAQTNLHVTPVIDPQTGEYLGWDARVICYGMGEWVDPDTLITYEVADPLRAHLGGTTGLVYISQTQQWICLDPATQCTGLPSYLVVPDDYMTVTDLERSCDGSGSTLICGLGSSFLNRDDYACTVKFVRNGARTNMRSGTGSRGDLRSHLQLCEKGSPNDVSVFIELLTLGAWPDDQGLCYERGYTAPDSGLNEAGVQNWQNCVAASDPSCINLSGTSMGGDTPQVEVAYEQTRVWNPFVDGANCVGEPTGWNFPFSRAHHRVDNRFGVGWDRNTEATR